MGLTGKFQFRKSLWGKVVLQVEEDVKPLWSNTGALKRRWRDATLMDLAAPQMRPLIDMRFRPQLAARASVGLEEDASLRQQHEAHPEIGAPASVLNGEMRRTEH